jgi:hypothetical protein
MVHDAEKRLWGEIEALHDGYMANRLELGKRFLQLQLLYSERSNYGGRRLSGKGVFEEAIKARGFKPRTVRGWINDYLADRDGSRISEREKRAARRRKWQPSANDWANYFKGGGHCPHCGFHSVVVDAEVVPVSVVPISVRKERTA